MLFELVDRLTDSQTADLTRLYQNEWWTEGRQLEEVRETLAATDVVVGLVNEEGRLVGFCRVLIDYVFRGTLYDVIVDPEFRGCGLGRRLLQGVSAHPRLTRLEKLYLACKPEMADFYALESFAPLTGELVWMMRGSRHQ